MVAIFLDDNKPKISLKKWIRTVSNFVDLIRFHFLFNIGEFFWGWILKDRICVKKKKIFVWCSPTPLKRAHEIRKFHVIAAVVPRRLRNVQKRDARAALLFCLWKPIAFLPFSLPSLSSLVKLSIVVIWKFCYHGNVTSHFSSLSQQA